MKALSAAVVWFAQALCNPALQKVALSVAAVADEFYRKREWASNIVFGRNAAAAKRILTARSRRRRALPHGRGRRAKVPRRKKLQPRRNSSRAARSQQTPLNFDYLIVDGHSVIFAWPELRALHARRNVLARDELVKRLRNYQDWTGVRVVVVFDGQGSSVEDASAADDVQVFYSRHGQTADAVIERLASKYAGKYRLLVATDDYMEQQTASACGADCVSAEALRGILDEPQQRQR